MFEENWDLPVPPPKQLSQSSIKEKSMIGKKTEYDSDSWRYRDPKVKSVRRSKYNSTNGPIIMKVDNTKIGKVIGKQGSKISDLQEKTDTRIWIANTCDTDSNVKTIKIYGDLESQNKCKELIEEIIREKPQRNIKLVQSYGLTKPEIPIIDWDAIDSKAGRVEAEKFANDPDIKKNFYIEDPEVAQMTEEEVEEFRKTKGEITVKNLNGGNEKILNPVKTFQQAFKRFPRILETILKLGFENPSPIQCQAWPLLLSGRDLIGIAQTGTGKTFAFLLPALIHIEEQGMFRPQIYGPNVLIIAPTRELALQIENEVKKFAHLGFRSVTLYGGVNLYKQISFVSKGVQIIVATPGRLIDLIQRNAVDVRSVSYLVLDEADRLLDMGFEPQIKKIMLDIRPETQFIMTSATWPLKIQNLAERYMKNPVQVVVGSLNLTAVHSVTQIVYVVREDEKMDYLLEFLADLSENDKVLIFVGRKTTANNLSCDLILNHVLCQCVHGDYSQQDREQALDDFRSGVVKILIATDVFSRGLDVSGVTKVFNYDFPNSMSEYVHRIGRTGRAGKKGVAVSLFTRVNAVFVDELINILEEAEEPIPLDLMKFKKQKDAK